MTIFGKDSTEMAKQKVTFDELMLLAKRYGLESNELFISCANQYDLQQKVIRNIKEAIESEESMTVSKEYVKNRLNVYANPLVKELPKHSDSANKTLAMMLDIIEKLGTKEQKPKSKLESLMDE